MESQVLMRAALFAWMTLWLVCGCSFSPDYAISSCEVSCTQDCPSGFTCQQGYCVREGLDLDCRSIELIAPSDDYSLFACEHLDLPIKVRDGDGPYEWRLLNSEDQKLPKELSLVVDGDTAHLSAAPGAFDASERYEIRVEASDSNGRHVDETVALQVLACPNIDLASRLDLCVGQDVDFPFGARGGHGNYRWEVAGPLPEGVSIDSDGIALKGRPTEQSVGTWRIELKLRDYEALPQEGEVAKATFTDTAQVTLRVDDCVRIDEESRQVCAGDEFKTVLTAKGGKGPYEWSADGELTDFDLDPSTGELEGRATSLGEQMVTLTAQDKKGEVSEPFDLTIRVEQCADISTTAVDACVDTPLEFDLEALPTGQAWVWTAQTERKDLTLEADGTLVWTPQKPERNAELKVEVRDKQETYSPRSGTILLTAWSQDEVPCLPPVTLATPSLPDACAGDPYQFQLKAAGGTGGGYNWAKDNSFGAWPAWLNLNTKTGVLSGVPPPGDTVVVPLNFIIGPTLASAYLPLTVRETCKYSFIGSVQDQQRLYLADVRQRTGLAGTSPVDLSAPWTDELDVVDFAFEPEGRWIAWLARPRDTELGHRLFVQGLIPFESSATEVDLDELGAERVLLMAWSRGSSRLGVMFATSQGSEVATYGVEASAEGTTLLLGERVRVAPAGVGDLWWLEDYLCYMAFRSVEVDDIVRNFIGATCLEVETSTGAIESQHAVDGFPDADFGPDAELGQFFSTGTEVFMIKSPGDPLGLWVLSLNGNTLLELTDQWKSVPDPSFTRIAQYGDTSLGDPADDVGIFEVADRLVSDNWPLPTDKTVHGCDSIQAWERAGLGLVCDDGASLRVALLDRDGTVLRQERVSGTTAFAGKSRARSFTQGQDWFVYEPQDGQLDVIDLRAGNWQPQSLLTHEGQALLMPTRQVHQLLFQHAQSLEVLDLDAGRRNIVSGEVPVAAPFSCVSDFSRGGPLRWCGGELQRASFSVTNQGEALVFVDEDGFPYVVDLLAPDLYTAALPNVRVGDATVECDPGAGCRRKIRAAR